MKIAFCTSDDPGSAIIRAATWSEFSHVAQVLPDGERVVEAVLPGVRVTSIEQLVRNHTRISLVDIPCADEGAAAEAALSQVGKPYDWRALLGIGLHRDWQSDEKWFCSELLAWCLAQGGKRLFRAEAMRRVTPQHLWALNFPVFADDQARC
ncbi:YiiX/YebB-like N1pC/P60 family cysteine hydrolase [Paraburkholderia sp. PREW-6R]|uniref:YiiX/YebB-like N1pC/P60 family cysteine hydrolase n=1 Tax=Paraburkholderia sp. PREW-6R TaxID=3141544 RepID=UPI0031F58980